MGKKHKKQNCTVYGIVEDQIEFVEFLRETYKPDQNNITLKLQDSEGGYPDRIVGFAIRECHRDRSFAWLDEDFEPANTLGRDMRNQLAKCWKIESENLDNFLKCPLRDLQTTYNSENKKPILIISKPVCSESIIIQALGEKIPDSCKTYNPATRDTQIKALKHKLDRICNNDKMDFYRKNLDKDILEEKRKLITELDLLISMITK